jgi:predicted RNase H-like nuclease (RuvC/YqgF family)
MSNPHELKALQTRLKEAQAEAESLVEKARIATKDASEALRRKDKIAAQIREIEEAAKEPIVTEHAMLRYIERFMDVDLEAVRKAILTDEAVKMIKFARSGKITANGRRLIVKNGSVVTVEPIEREAA